MSLKNMASFNKQDFLYTAASETNDILADENLMPKLQESIKQGKSGTNISLDQLKNNLGLG